MRKLKTKTVESESLNIKVKEEELNIKVQQDPPMQRIEVKKWQGAGGGKIGRKGIYTPEIVNKILNKIRHGMSNRDAATLVGINNDTLYDWINKYSDFSDKLHQALMEFKQKHVIGIEKHGNRDWKARKFLLQVKFPEEFGKESDNSVNFTFDFATENELKDAEIINQTNQIEKK